MFIRVKTNNVYIACFFNGIGECLGEKFVMIMLFIRESKKEIYFFATCTTQTHTQSGIFFQKITRKNIVFLGSTVVRSIRIIS